MADFRKILHIDLDAFFCAVEEKLDPEIEWARHLQWGERLKAGGW